MSGQIIIFHQPRFPWNKGISLTKPPFGVRSCEVAIIWPDHVTPTFASTVLISNHFCSSISLYFLGLFLKIGATGQPPPVFSRRKSRKITSPFAIFCTPPAEPPCSWPQAFPKSFWKTSSMRPSKISIQDQKNNTWKKTKDIETLPLKHDLALDIQNPPNA